MNTTELVVEIRPEKKNSGSWLVSSVGRMLQQSCKGHGFKSHTGLNFFQVLFQLLVQ